MTYASILVAILQNAGALEKAVGTVIAAIRAGKANEPVSEADWVTLASLATQTSADIYKREGVALPPSSP